MANDPIHDDAVAQAQLAPTEPADSPRERLVVEQRPRDYQREEGDAAQKRSPVGAALARAWSVDGATWRALCDPSAAASTSLRRRSAAAGPSPRDPADDLMTPTPPPPSTARPPTPPSATAERSPPRVEPLAQRSQTLAARLPHEVPMSEESTLAPLAPTPRALLHANTAALHRANEILERLLAGKVERTEPRSDKLAKDGPALGLARTWMFDSGAWRTLAACAPEHAARFLRWARRYAARARTR